MTMTVREIMREYGLCRQAVMIPIHCGRLKARKKSSGKTHMWLINRSDFDTYRESRYKHPRKSNGEVIYDKDKGLYSVKEAAEQIGCDRQRVYYHLRIGLIKSKRIGTAWVIHINDIKDYKSKLRKSKRHPRVPYKQMKKNV